MRSNAYAIAKPERTGFSPLIMGAAASVTVMSLLGIAAVTGVLPRLLAQTELPEAREAAPAYRPLPGKCAICGAVVSISTVEVAEETDPASAAGGPSGAVVGHQAGRGGGNIVMTILSAGGAFGSNDADGSAKKRYVYRVTVRMDDGSYRTVSLPAPPAFGVGDKVRVVESKLVRA